MLLKSRLSAISLSILAASLMTVSTANAANYKGDGGYKEMAQPAAPVMNNTGLKDGFYVGAQLGYDSYRTHVTNGITTETGDAFSFSRNQSATGFMGGLFAGYGKYFDTFYLGGELFLNDSNASGSNNLSATQGGSTDTLSSKSSVNASWGIAVLPGVKVNDSSLAYLRLGYNQARLTGKDTAADSGGTESSSKTTWQGGYNLGLGLETALCPNLSLRTEFNHAQYSSFHDAVGAKYEASDNQFTLGLSYHFA